MALHSPRPRTLRTARPARAGRVPAPPLFHQPENYQPNESVGYMMRRIVNMMAAQVDRELEPNDLTSAQWVPLLKLHMRGAASTIAELARDCQLDAGSMTRLLDRLEAKGLLRRVRSSEDRRVVHVELTHDGRAAAKKIPAVLCGVQNAHTRGFTAEEWQLLKGMLRRILDNAIAIQVEKEGQQ
jgi:DNA-binding MarR family transcriptional regulator